MEVWHGTSDFREFCLRKYGAAWTPLYLTSDRERAVLYARARTASDMRLWDREDLVPVILRLNVPDRWLERDEYSPNEPDQWKLRQRINYWVKRAETEEDEPWPPKRTELLRLCCFCIGMDNYEDDRKETRVGKELTLLV